MTPTGASADEWVPVKPGTEGVLALGLAHVILRDKLRPADERTRGRADRRLGGGPPDYAPEKVERDHRRAGERIERLARELADRSPSVAIAGGAPLAHTNGLFTALAVNALNALLGSRRTAGRAVLHAAAARSADVCHGRRSTSLQRVCRQSAQRCCCVDDANPVFAAPKAWKVREALDKGAVHRQLRQLHRRDERARRSDPAGSFVPRVVGRRAARIGIAGRGRRASRRPAMKPLLPDARDGRRAARRRRQAAEAARPAVADLRRDAQGDVRWLGEDAWRPRRSRAAGGAICRAAADGAVAADGRSAAVHVQSPPAFDGDAGAVSVPLPAVRVAAVLRRLARASAVAAGDAGSDDSAMWSSWVEINPKTAERWASRRATSSKSRRRRARCARRRSSSRHRARHRRDAGRTGTRDVHALRDRPRREPGRDPRAGRRSAETGALAWAATRVKLRASATPTAA